MEIVANAYTRNIGIIVTIVTIVPIVTIDDYHEYCYYR